MHCCPVRYGGTPLYSFFHGKIKNYNFSYIPTFIAAKLDCSEIQFLDCVVLHSHYSHDHNKAGLTAKKKSLTDGQGQLCRWAGALCGLAGTV